MKFSPRLHRAAAAVGIAALTLTACTSDDDAVSSDPEVQQSEEVQDAEVAPVDSGDAATDGEAGVVDADPAGLQQFGPIEVEGAALAPFDAGGEDPAVGTPAPIVRGESFDGTEIVIGAPTENPTMIVFLAHWCGHCNAEVPVLVGLEEDDRLPDGLDVVGVSTAVAADRENFPPSQWIDDKGWSWPTMADDEVQTAITALGGTAFPFTVVLDADGTVLARRAGEATGDDTVAFLDEALANATA